MVGGKIIRIYDEGDSTTLAVFDRKDLCHVRVDVGPARFRVGDSVWWQGAQVMWSPADGSAVDVVLPKAGYSYSGPYSGNGRPVHN
jgi:hypothetical protein